MPIPLSVPCLEGNEQAYLDECVRTNFVSSVGPFVERFEREFADWVGAKHAVACATGTAALHVALRLFDVKPGDEVFVADFTFAASANAITYEHAKPVLVDSEETSWNMDPALVVAEIERRARAGEKQPAIVEAVHILGHPADIAPLVDVCAKHGITLIEDAAEALGARWTEGPLAGKHVGTIGRVGCFSFNGNKIMTTGGGGMIVTEDAALAKRAKHLTTQARMPGLEYCHDEIGFNYRLTNVAAAIGVAQLEQLERFVRRKAEIAARYDAELGSLPGVGLPPRAPWARPTMWLYSILVDPAAFGVDSRAVIGALRDAGIESRPLWQPLSRMAPFRDAKKLGGLVGTKLFERGVSLPCSPSLTDAEQSVVIDVVRRAARA